MDLVDIDHYKILGLPSGEEGAKLSEEDISKAYHSKALELNPDKRPNDPNAHQIFQCLKTSYVILKDEKARKLFDDLLRVRLEKKLQRLSQHDSQHPRMMSDLDEREQTSFAPDPNSQAKDEEERISTMLKEEITRIRVMHGNAAASSTSGLKKLTQFGGQDSRDGIQSGQIPLFQRLFGENFKVESNWASSYTKKRNPRFYGGDIVQRNSDGMRGVVIKVAGDIDSGSDSSESDIYTEDSDDEKGNVEKNEECDADSGNLITEGSTNYILDDEVKVLWWDGSYSAPCVKDVRLLDRYFYPGEFVAKASEPTCQVGVVVNVHTTVQLADSDYHPIMDIGNVPSRELKRMWEFEVGDHVICGYWIGTIDAVSRDVTVVFKDQSVCVMQATKENYLGETVKATFSSDDLKNARWLNGSLKDGVQGTVTKLKVNSASITWFHNNDPGTSTTPAKEQNAKNLKLLPHFSHAKWKYNKSCLYSSKAKVGISKSDLKVGSVHEDFERACVIFSTKSKVDVAWQDGSIENGLESIKLVTIPGDHAFFSGQYVMEKEVDDGRNRIAMVKCVNVKERIALVRWLKLGATTSEDEFEEEVSLYELEAHPTYDYHYGDVVVRRPPVSVPAHTESPETYDDQNELEGNTACLKKEDGYGTQGFGDLSWVGTITGLRNGVIEVAWADGMRSMVGPLAIDVLAIDVLTEVVDGNEEETIQSTVGPQTRNDESVAGEDDINSSVPDDEADTLQSLSIPSASTGYRKSEVDPTKKRKRSEVDTSCSKDFNTAEAPIDHYYLGSSVNQPEKKWLRKMQQDWRMLQDTDNLPDGICVRLYDDRMDLLRAAIVGAHGTPYQYGLFFFDFHLPAQYPDVPPSVHFHSRGWKINPNLYENGKICLSLLNTWQGTGREVWASSSTILQVLLSLQGLVLNSKPFFNEAGYDKDVGTSRGEKLSLDYNEGTFLLNCKMMLNHIRNPLKGFEEHVKEHFKDQGYYILKAIAAYREGSLIGSLGKDACVGSRDESGSKGSISTDYSSRGFKISLGKIQKELFIALKEIGAEVEEFKYLE